MVLANPDTGKPKLAITVGRNGINTIQEYCNPCQSRFVGLGLTVVIFIDEKAPPDDTGTAFPWVLREYLRRITAAIVKR